MVVSDLNREILFPPLYLPFFPLLASPVFVVGERVLKENYLSQKRCPEKGELFFFEVLRNASLFVCCSVVRACVWRKECFHFDVDL